MDLDIAIQQSLFHLLKISARRCSCFSCVLHKSGLSRASPNTNNNARSALPLINGKPITKAPDGGLVVASSTVAPGSQATISGHTISVGLSDAAIDGSEYALPTLTAERAPLFTAPLANGIVASPDGKPNEVEIGGNNTSVDEPAVITISGTAVSLAPNELYFSSLVPPFTGATNRSSAGLGDLVMSAFQSGQRAAGNGGNGSDLVAFTGGTLRSSHFQSNSVLAFITAFVAMADLVS